MKCPVCSVNYDSKDKVPRLLIKCGHTACHQCLLTKYEGGCIKCPKCGCDNYGETIDDFPKNLALLDMRTSGYSKNPKRKRNGDKSIRIERSSFYTRTSQEEICLIHSKKFEAFCKKSRRLMCIGCILENKDNSKNLVSIEDAINKELEEAKANYSVAGNLEEKIEQIKDNVADFLRKLNVKKKENEKLIDGFFKKITDMIKVRKTEVSKKMKKDYKKEEKRALDLVDRLDIHLSQIRGLIGMIERMSEISEIETLKLSKARYNLSQECSFEPKQHTSRPPSFVLKLDLEMRKITSLLSPLGAGVKDTNIKSSKSKKKQKGKGKSSKKNLNTLKKTNSMKRESVKREHLKKETTSTSRKYVTGSFIKDHLSSGAMTPARMGIYPSKSSPHPLNTNKFKKKKKKYKEHKSRYSSPKHEKFKIMHLQAEKMSLLSESGFTSMNETLQKGLFRKHEIVTEDSLLGNLQMIRDQDFSQNFKKTEEPNVEDLKILTSSMLMDKEQCKMVNISQIEQEGQNDETQTNFSIMEKFDLNVEDFKLGDSIYVIGGASKLNKPLNILRYDIQENKWFDVGVEFDMIKGAAISLPTGNIALVGGKNKITNNESISEYKILDNTVTSLSENCAFLKRTGFSAIQGENYFFVLGGNDGQKIVSDTFCVSISTYEAVNIPNMLIAREDLASEIDKEGKLYAVGGFGGYLKTCLSSIEYFDPGSNTWEMLTEMSCGRRAPGCVLIGSDLFVVGGYDGFKYLNTAEKFNLVTHEWSKIEQLSEERCMFSVVKDQENNKFYILGGFKNNAINSVDCYNLTTQKWSGLAPIPEKRYLHASVLLKT